MCSSAHTWAPPHQTQTLGACAHNSNCQGYLGACALSNGPDVARAESWPAGRGLWPSWKCTAEKTSRIAVRLYSKDCSDTWCSCCGHQVDKESQEQSRTQQNSNILMCVVRVTITLWFENMNNYEHFPTWPQLFHYQQLNTEKNGSKWLKCGKLQQLKRRKFCWFNKKIKMEG